jgi:hypothetical protein
VVQAWSQCTYLDFGTDLGHHERVQNPSQQIAVAEDCSGVQTECGADQSRVNEIALWGS